MLEVWVCKEEPSVRLVIPAGGTMPADLGNRDWTLSGPFAGDAEIEAAVAEKGYHFINANGAGDAPDGLTDPSPADRQGEIR